MFTISDAFAFICVYLRLGFCCLLAVAATAGPCQAAAPVLKSLEPRGAQRGQAFKLTLIGEYLQAGAEISTTLPATFSRLAAAPEKGDSELPLLVQLKEDAGPGLYPIRLRTEDGLSNVLLFSVGTLPETVEEESLLKEPSEKDHNDSQAKAQKLAVPITVNGTLVGPDQDYYRFSAKAGERLVFEVDARRAGSAIDPIVRVFNSTGKELAANNDAPGMGVDARVEVTFAQAGDYVALVHDAKYSDQEQNFYRLKIGAFPYAESMFPLGWQRGKPVEVTLSGGNLRAPVKVKPQMAPPDSDFLPVALPGSASLPFLLRLSDWPELLEVAESGAPGAAASPGTTVRASKLAAAPKEASARDLMPLPPSTVVNGRISRPGEVDKYRVRVSPGQHWTFEVEAASLGVSKLLGVLSVYEARVGRRLALTELGPEAGTNPFSFESSRNEVDPRIHLTIPQDVTEVIVGLEDLLGRGGPNFGYRLMASPQPPDFTLELVTPFVNIPANGTAAVEVLVSRRGYDGPIRLRIPDLPEDIVQEGGNIPAELNPPEDRRAFAPGYLTLTAKPEAAPRSIRLTVLGEAVSSEVPIRKTVIAPGLVQTIRGTRQKPFKAPWLGTGLPTAVVKPVPLRIEFPTRHIRVVQGMDYSLAWKLVKESAVSGAIKVENPRPTASIKDLRVLRRPEGMEYMEEGTFHILTTFATPLVTFDLVADASRIAGNKTERLITSPAVTVEIVPGYELKISEKLELKRGGRTAVAGKIKREPGFNAIVRVRAEDLPEQVSCEEVLVAADRTDFQLVFEAAPGASPGNFEVRLASAATLPERADQQEFKIPDLKAQLIVMPGAAVTASKQ